MREIGPYPSVSVCGVPQPEPHDCWQHQNPDSYPFVEPVDDRGLVDDAIRGDRSAEALTHYGLWAHGSLRYAPEGWYLRTELSYDPCAVSWGEAPGMTPDELEVGAAIRRAARHCGGAVDAIYYRVKYGRWRDPNEPVRGPSSLWCSSEHKARFILPDCLGIKYMRHALAVQAAARVRAGLDTPEDQDARW